MPTDPVFLHAHIQKCGGTSFDTVLWENFRPGWVSDYGLLSNLSPKTPWEMNRLLEQRPFLRAFSSHGFPAALDYENAPRPFVTISFVRDPVDRFLSHYNYHQGLRTGRAMEAPRRMALDDYARWVFEEGYFPRDRYGDGQLRHLAVDADRDAVEQVRTLVERGHLHLFPLTSFADAMLVLNRRYPESFRDVAYRRRNVTRGKSQPSAAIRELIARNNQLDTELHRFAQESFERELAGRFSTAELESARRVLARRCRWRDGPVYELWRAFRRLTEQVALYRPRHER